MKGHVKRTRKQNKLVKQMQKRLDTMLGENGAGLMLSLLCDLLNKFVDGVDHREMRTLELKLNDYFSVKFDFEKEEIVNEQK